ncbi:hypothetical protein AB833_16070 [Chromatiales bacterium (ex Bugula neritina AB1)]|nr:hypothetical protein AB833_16070 [Chromatiales bacterium (ex Bugula neritina AB1)]
MTKKKDYRVSNQKQICWLLNSLMSQHRLVTLSVDGGGSSGSSIVVNVSIPDACFTLDAVLDPGVHSHIVAGRPFSMYSTLDGVDVCAESIHAVATSNDPDGAVYQVSIPPEIIHMQRRETFRASTTGLFVIPVRVQVPDLEPAENADTDSAFDCTLSNLSADGCELSVCEDYGELLSEHSSPLELQFEIPDTHDLLTFSALRRHSRHVRRSEIWLIGFKFVETPLATQNILGRFVARLQLLSRQKSTLAA